MNSNGETVYVVTNTVNHFPSEKEFDQRVLGCCVYPKECCYMTCCFPCALSELGEFTETKCCADSCLCWLIMSHCCFPCGTVIVRENLKEKLSIKTSPCDPCISFICFPCASCQTYHEMKLAKLRDTDAIHESLINQPIVVQRMDR